MPTPPDIPPATQPDRLPSRAFVLSAVGVLLLALWAFHWLASWKQNHLKHSPKPWLSRYEYFGIDFLHNYFAARHWANGGDPFREPFGDPIPPPHTRKLVYPPIVIPVFAWCRTRRRPTHGRRGVDARPGNVRHRRRGGRVEGPAETRVE